MNKTANPIQGAVLVLGLLLALPTAMAANDGAPAADKAAPAETPAETTATASEDTTEADAPVQRRIVFQSKESLTFKQKIQIYNRSKDQAEQLYCREDRPTGSHRKRMRCVTNETRQLEEDSARLFFMSLPRGRPY